MYDIRDNKPYTVRKLADGNCWMTDNLAFELQANQTYTGVDNATGQEVSFNTGAACSTNGDCIMNGNTAYGASTGQWYYSWYAATAGTGTSSQTNIDAQYSICPKGWRLPANYTVSTTKTYSTLTNAYLGFTGNTTTSTGYQTMESTPLNFARTGYFLSGSYDNNGRAYHWTSTAYSSNTLAYGFDYRTTNVDPQDWNSKIRGTIVRCVAL